MKFAVLGPLEVRARDGSEVVLGAPKLRALLIDLLLEPGRVVPFDRLVEDLWDGDPPAQPMVSLRSYVSNLRRVLDGDGGRPLVVTRGPGYVLDVAPQDVDVTVFEQALAAARRALRDDAADLATARLDEALALWRGPALADVADLAFARAPIARLEQLRSTAVEDRLEALLRAGHHDEVIAEAEAHVLREPLRERPRVLLMHALHRTGRGPDALAVHRDLRGRLAQELGLDPSPQVERLAAQILRQDPALDAAVAPTVDTTVAPMVDATGGATGGDDGGPGSRPVAEVVAAPADPGHAARRRRPGRRLVGRDAQLARCDELLADALVGDGGLLLVSGEPGIGKSALLGELAGRAAARGVPVAWGRCDETQGAPPFWPWTQVVRTFALQLDDEALRAAVAGAASGVARLEPSITARTGVVAEVTAVDPQSARFTLYEAAAVFLERIAARTGAVVLVDDLHWGDQASCELSAFLGARAPRAGVVLAVAHRDAPIDVTPALRAALAGIARQAGVVRLWLGPLDDDHVDDVVRQVVDDASAEDLGRVRARADGNPFHARQLARLVTELPRDGPPSAVVVPSGIREVVLHRLGRLPTEVRQVLDVASLLGQEIDVRVLAQGWGGAVGDVLDHLDVAATHGLVEFGEDPTHGVRFVHGLVRDTLRTELAPGRRVRLHAAIADALWTHTPHQDPAATAQHLFHAADLLGPGRPVRALRDAAERAAEVFGYEQAQEALRRALRLLERRGAGGDGIDAGVELAVRLRLIQVLTGLHGWTSPAIEEVAAPVRDLAATSGIASETVPLWWSLWTSRTTRGQLDVATGLAHQLLDAAAPGGDPVGLVAGHVSVAYSRLFGGAPHADVVAHLELARVAERDADAARLAATAEHLSVALRIAHVMAEAVHGNTEAAMAAADEAVAFAGALAQPFQLAYAHMFGALGAAMLDQPAPAAAHGDAGLAVCDDAGLGYLALLTTPPHGWARARLGGDAGTEAARIATATDALADAGQQHVLPLWRLLLAETHLAAGERDAARAALEAAVATVATTGELVYDRQLERVRRALGQPDPGVAVPPAAT